MALPTADKALEHAREWLAAERGVTIGDDDSISVDGDPPIGLDLAVEDERLIIRHVAKEDGAGAARADSVVAAIPDRGTQLDVAAEVSKSGVTFTYSNQVYLDGFSRQAVISAMNELVSVIDRVGVGAGDGDTSPMETETEPVTGAQPATPPDAATAVIGDIFTEDTAESTTQVPIDTTGWAPTHRVPSSGIRAWDQPDPSLQPSNRLEARVELQLTDRRGDWAQVVGSNGWTGWVDARNLEAMTVPAGDRGSRKFAVGGLEFRIVPLVGAALLLLATFMPWVDAFGRSSNSFEVALSFLWDTGAAGNPYLGWALVAIAVITVSLAAAKKTNAGLLIALGVITIAIAAIFLVQMYRGVSDSGGSFGDVFDFLGIAPWVAVASGLVLIVGARR